MGEKIGPFTPAAQTFRWAWIDLARAGDDRIRRDDFATGSPVSTATPSALQFFARGLGQLVGQRGKDARAGLDQA